MRNALKVIIGTVFVALLANALWWGLFLLAAADEAKTVRLVFWALPAILTSLGTLLLPFKRSKDAGALLILASVFPYIFIGGLLVMLDVNPWASIIIALISSVGFVTGQLKYIQWRRSWNR